MSNSLFHDTLPGGQATSLILRRHQTLRLTDPSGTATVAGLIYRADAPLERYNMPDTLKAQHTAFLTTGRVVMSDMGHVLLSIIDDTCGWHDTLSGHQDAADSLLKFGPGSYQERRNDRIRNTRDNFLVELGKHELGARDLHANVNFFTKVVVDPNGALRYVSGNSHPGAWIELRAEMAVLIVLSNTPHPLDPSTTYAPAPIALIVGQAPPPAADDPCRISRPECERAFARTEALALALALETSP